jgi:hypothetical protein
MPSVVLALVFVAQLIVSPAAAGRPSLNKLNAEVNQLQAILGDQPVAVDANGTVIGAALGHAPIYQSDREVWITESAHTFSVSLGLTRVATSAGADLALRVYFLEPDCAGPAYFPVRESRIDVSVVVPIDTSLPLLLEDIDAEPFTDVALSETDELGFSCNDSSRSLQLLPAIPLFIWDDRFTPPYRIVPRGSIP